MNTSSSQIPNAEIQTVLPEIGRRTYNKQKHWCFTNNNPTVSDRECLHSIENEGHVLYIVYGSELGEKHDIPHLQGFVTFANRKSLAQVRAVLPRAHWEAKSRHSTYKEAIDYCKKDGDYVEWGEPPVDPAVKLKRRWTKAFEDAKVGDFESIPKDMLIRYYHSFKRIQQDYPTIPKNNEKTCGQWYVGPTGFGKTRTAVARYPNLYDKPLNKWWDGYRGQETVLIDDLAPAHGKWIGHLMKRWADWKSFPAEQKGTTVMIRPKRIIVTSQYTIDEVFYDPQDKCTVDAIKRRFKVTNFTCNVFKQTPAPANYVPSEDMFK